MLPATDFIDAYMRALGRRYYVGLLSAAELWGAAHQRPQTFQVVVDKNIADKDFGRVKLRFYTANRAGRVPVAQRASVAASFLVSSPPVTLLDIADRPRECGGVNNVATVAHELVDEQKPTGPDLAAAAADFPAAAARRLGWLLTHTGADIDLRPLRELSARHPTKRSTTYLDPTGPRAGATDRTWQIIINTEVEADL
ncbi:MAG TPA: type IV toxin-antitoxin system AbiEi family antitoxin [Jatrophihabitans sp.]|nr:type IV toxin-antitoxin system AbiEi family antitoxin [Jatrophihabitans sp.]